VLLLVWEQPPMTIGQSFLNELVERAGGRNLFADLRKTAGTVSIEAVAVRDPDLILTTTDGPAAFTTRPEWQVVRAVRSAASFGSPARSSTGRARARRAIRELAARIRSSAP